MENIKELVTNQYFLLAIAVIPGLIYVSIYYNLDKRKKEPLGVILKTFLWGALVTIPIAFFQMAIPSEGLQAFMPFNAVYMILAVGFTEEFSKWFVTRYYAFRNDAFDEVTDGLVYGASAAGGFAVFENIFYVLDHGFETALIRAALSVPGHMFWGAISGYWLAMYKFGGVSRSQMLLKGLLFVSLMHGLFNTFLNYAATIILSPAIIAWCGLLTRKYYRAALAFDEMHIHSYTVTAETSEFVERHENGELRYKKEEMVRYLDNPKLKKVLSPGFRFFGWIFILTGIMAALGTFEQLDESKELSIKDMLPAFVLLFSFVLIGVLSWVHGWRLKKEVESMDMTSESKSPAGFASFMGMLAIIAGGVILLGVPFLVADFFNAEKALSIKSVMSQIMGILLFSFAGISIMIAGLGIRKRKPHVYGHEVIDRSAIKKVG